MHLSSNRVRNSPFDVSSFRSFAAHVFHAPARLAAVLLLTAALATSAFAGSAANASTLLTVKVTEGASNWNLPLGPSFLTVNPDTGVLTMPAYGTDFGPNWGWDKVNVLQRDGSYVEKDAVTWRNGASTAGVSIYATGNVDPFMTYAISARNTSGVTQTYSLHIDESIMPPISPGTYGLYSDIAGSISNGAGSITIAPAVGSTIQKLGLSTDYGSTFFTAGVDLGAAQTETNLATTPYDFDSVSGGGSTLSTINHWSFDVSFTLTPNDSAAISGFAEITQLTLIPEPSTYAALMGTVTLLGVTLRRRRQVAA